MVGLCLQFELLKTGRSSWQTCRNNHRYHHLRTALDREARTIKWSPQARPAALGWPAKGDLAVRGRLLRAVSVFEPTGRRTLLVGSHFECQSCKSALKESSAMVCKVLAKDHPQGCGRALSEPLCQHDVRTSMLRVDLQEAAFPCSGSAWPGGRDLTAYPPAFLPVRQAAGRFDT